MEMTAAARALLASATIAALLVPAAARACAVIPPPFSPKDAGYDTVIHGTVVKVVRGGDSAYADIAVQRVRLGSYAKARHRIFWATRILPGMCPSRNPAVRMADKVAVYLERDSGAYVTVGWLLDK